MPEPALPDASKTPFYVWLSLALTVVGSIIAFAAGQYYQLNEFKLKVSELELRTQETQLKQQEAELRQLDRDDRVHTLKIEIIKQIKDANFALANAIMDYLLKPIEKNETIFGQFRTAMNELKSDTAPKLAGAASTIATNDGWDFDAGDWSYPLLSAEYIRKNFSGKERLAFRNELIRHYQSNPDEVIKVLMDAIIPPQQPNTFRYRINLYIAFTLGGIPGGWKGTQSQITVLSALKNTAEYSDVTFRNRLDEAIAAYKRI